MNPSAFYNRCIVLCLLFVSGLSVLSVRLIYLHVVKANDYQVKSAKTTEPVVLLANRGCIVDCNNQLIARNIPRARMAIDKLRLNNPAVAALSLANKELRETAEWYLWDQNKRNRKVEARAAGLKAGMKAEDMIAQHINHVVETFARPLGMTPAMLRQRMKLNKEDQKYVVIKSDLSEEDAENMKRLAHDYSISPSIVFEEWQKRWYVMPNMAAAIVGYVGEDADEQGRIVRGRSGIENKMNDELAGKNGNVITHKNKYRPLDIAKPGKVTPPRHGLNVQLTLDMGMQRVLEEELEAGLEKFSSVKGAIVLMNPKNGAIMAMASRPSYNLNTRKNITQNGFDYATQAIYEPGSTFKIISTAGAMNEGFIQPDTIFDCAPYREGSVRVRDYKTFGDLTVQQILAKSSNIGSYKVALELGPDKFFEYLSAFGFGAKTNILMAGESAGVVRNTGNPTDFSRISYGYAVSVTPLQVACAYSAIANDGVLMKPQLLKSMMADNGATTHSYDKVRVRRVIKSETAEKMRQALATVVDEKGTARRAKVEGFIVAGKTGTTVKIHPDGGYYNGENDRDKRYTTSFAGMMPADQPEFVCVVVIDDPSMPDREEGKPKVTPGGGNVAAPIFSKVATRVANLMGMKPSKQGDPTQTVAKSEL
ncbi:MAG: penicillin-binding protein 2 [Akkermansiaceae bacterium]|nr:penicillin-binding protein 2 [Akkermansiaceae bacterium]